MEKIPSLYIRDPETALRYVSRELNPRCAWVVDPGIEKNATVKWDGTCVMLDRHGQWWARHQLRPGRTAPPVYHPVEHDPVTGKTQGWIPAETSQYWRHLADAIDYEENCDIGGDPLGPGTYELVGPKIGANPHNFHRHFLAPHGGAILSDVPTGFDELREFCNAMHDATEYFEGIVWHERGQLSAPGRRAKIKRKDFPS